MIEVTGKEETSRIVVIDDELERSITDKVNKFVSMISATEKLDDNLLTYISDLFISDLINTLVNNPSTKTDLSIPNF